MELFAIQSVNNYVNLAFIVVAPASVGKIFSSKDCSSSC